IAAALGVFAPMYLVVLLLAPVYRRIAANRIFGDFIAGVTAAAVGALAGGAALLGARMLVDVSTVLLAAAGLTVLVRWPRFPEPLLLLGAALVGLMLM